MTVVYNYTILPLIGCVGDQIFHQIYCMRYHFPGQFATFIKSVLKMNPVFAGLDCVQAISVVLEKNLNYRQFRKW